MFSQSLKQLRIPLIAISLLAAQFGITGNAVAHDERDQRTSSIEMKTPAPVQYVDEVDSPV